MNNTMETELHPVQLRNGVLLCAVVGSQLIVGEVAGSSAMLPDIFDYADECGCSSILFHTSRKGLLFKALDVTDALHAWEAPRIVGYVVEVRREGC